MFASTFQSLEEQADRVCAMPPPPAFHMSLETVYAPRVSLPKAADVENDGSVQLAPPETDRGGLTEGLAVGAVGSAVDWEGEAVGDVPGEEAEGDDGDGDDDEADDARDGDGAEIAPAGVAGPVAVTVFSIMAECLPLAAACLGT